MVIPFLVPLILGGIAGVVITAIVRFVLLHWKEIIGWFNKWKNNHEEVDKDAVGFTLREAIKNGEYNIVQGVFNKSSNTVEDARRIEAEELDNETKQQCWGKEKVTIFN